MSLVFVKMAGMNPITMPQIYPKSLRETFSADLCSAVEASSIISSALIPTLAMPPRTPTVAGTPPLTRTTDSSSDARAIFSGYGNPSVGLATTSSSSLSSSELDSDAVDTYRECKLWSQGRPPVSQSRQHHGPLLIPSRTCSAGSCGGHEDREREAVALPSTPHTERQLLRQTLCDSPDVNLGCRSNARSKAEMRRSCYRR